MSPRVQSLVDRWQDRAAVRAEHELAPTMRRRFDRIPERLASWRALRAERRARPRSAAEIDAAIGRTWGKVRPPC